MTSTPPRVQSGHGAPAWPVLLACAVIIEGVSLCLWPLAQSLDNSEHGSRFGEMLIQRHPGIGAVAEVLRLALDSVFPEARSTPENLVGFTMSCILVAFAAYAIAAWRLPRGSGEPRLVWIVAPLIVFQVTLFIVPASMTTDIFNYAIYGEMPVLYGANPFVHTPAEFPQNPLYYLIPLYWHDAPSVYGPFWVELSAVVARLFRYGPLIDELLFYRVLANLAHLANVFLVWALARKLRPIGAASAALAYGWNPLLLVDFALNGHNDVLMLTLTLAAILLAAARRHAWSVAILGLSIATKYASALLAPVLLLWLARQRLGAATPPAHPELVEGASFWQQLGRRRVASSFPGLRALSIAAVSGVSIVLLVAVLYARWFEGPGTFGPVLYWMSGPRLQNFWPGPLLAWVAGQLTWMLGVPWERLWDPFFNGFKIAAKAGLVALIGFEAWRARSLEHVLGAAARISLYFLLLVNTWVMPWYFTWPLALCAPLGWGSQLVRVCAGFTVTAIVLMYQRQYANPVVNDWGGAFQVLPIILLALPAIWAWIAPRPRA